MSWVRANALAFPLMPLVAALILVTITWPSRAEELGFRNPVVMVKPGATAVFEGFRWRLAPLTPDTAEVKKYQWGTGDNLPQGGRVVSYLVQADPVGAPLPPIACRAAYPRRPTASAIGGTAPGLISGVGPSTRGTRLPAS